MIHPFRGKVRPVEEIAELVGLPVEKVLRYIAAGECIPVPARLRRQPVHIGSHVPPVAQEKSILGMIAARKVAKMGGHNARTVTIDGCTYSSINEAAESLRMPSSNVRHAVLRHGTSISSEQIGLGKASRYEFDGYKIKGDRAAAKYCGVGLNTFIKRRKESKAGGFPLTVEYVRNGGKK